jgi:hypothetical protein
MTIFNKPNIIKKLMPKVINTCKTVIKIWQEYKQNKELPENNKKQRIVDNISDKDRYNSEQTTDEKVKRDYNNF